MAAIPPNNHLEGLIGSMKQGIYGAYNKGVKYGRYLERQERLNQMKESEWISAFDKTPYEGQRVVVLADNGLMAISIYEGNDDSLAIRFNDVKIGDCLYWHPIPEPPKED